MIYEIALLSDSIKEQYKWIHRDFIFDIIGDLILSE